MKRKDIIIRSKDIHLSYRQPYLICETVDGIQKINEGAISSIHLLEHCSIESSFFDLVYKQGIHVIIQNGKNRPICRCTPYLLKQDMDIAQKQLRQTALSADRPWRECCSWLHRKHANRVKLLSEFLDLHRIQEFQGRWYEDIDEYIALTKSEIRVKEAHSSKIYWRLYNMCLPHSFRFSKRSKRPAKDLTNVFLNYGYGILYSIIEKVILSHGLDPTLGIFHANGIGKKSLTYDMIEPHRHHIERLVIQFLRANAADMKDIDKNTSTLSTGVKSKYIQHWKEYSKKQDVKGDIRSHVGEFKEALSRNATKSKDHVSLGDV